MNHQKKISNMLADIRLMQFFYGAEQNRSEPELPRETCIDISTELEQAKNALEKIFNLLDS